MRAARGLEDWRRPCIRGDGLASAQYYCVARTDLRIGGPRVRGTSVQWAVQYSAQRLLCPPGPSDRGPTDCPGTSFLGRLVLIKNITFFVSLPWTHTHPFSLKPSDRGPTEGGQLTSDMHQTRPTLSRVQWTVQYTTLRYGGECSAVRSTT